MRKYILVAAVAAVAAGSVPAGAAVKRLIQNHDIAKNSITLNRLAPGTRALIEDRSTTVGPQGQQGAKGDTGAAGPGGAQGEKGSTGSTGANGAQGDTGAAGADGQDGATGAAGPQGDTGAPGAQGEKGDAGEPGTAGLNGVSGYEVRTYDYIAGAGHRDGHDGADAGYGGAGNSAIATVACSSQDKVAVGGGYWIRNGTNETDDGVGPNGAFTSPAIGQGAGVLASFPGRMDWSKNLPYPDRNDGWIVQFNGNGPALDVTLYAICVNAG